MSQSSSTGPLLVTSFRLLLNIAHHEAAVTAAIVEEDVTLWTILHVLFKVDLEIYFIPHVLRFRFCWD